MEMYLFYLWPVSSDVPTLNICLFLLQLLLASLGALMGHLFKRILLHEKVACKYLFSCSHVLCHPLSSATSISSAAEWQLKLKDNFSQKDYFSAALVPWPSASQFLSLGWHSVQSRVWGPIWGKQALILLKIDFYCKNHDLNKQENSLQLLS